MKDKILWLVIIIGAGVIGFLLFRMFRGGGSGGGFTPYGNGNIQLTNTQTTTAKTKM